MPAAEPTRNLEEIARLGVEAFDRYVRPNLRPEDDNKFVAIDIRSGEYEIDPDDYTAGARLRMSIMRDDSLQHVTLTSVDRASVLRAPRLH